ncbi:hypothetical protein SLS60_002733 [Paraconiothyrium brasiliense]|uniref:Uncharacterized protein n=1 Tax=Paraconiothyrium brasiliense TaxID=300254 RepID=A0ABR3RTN9_9PLEO
MANDPGAIRHSINRSTTELHYITSTRECPNAFEPQRASSPSQCPSTSADLSESSDDDDEIEHELQRLQREVDEQREKEKQHQELLNFCQEHSSLARQSTRKLKSDRELEVELRQLDEDLATLGEAKQKTDRELARANENLANLQNKWESLSIDHGSLRREHHQLQNHKETMARHNRKNLKELQDDLLAKDVEIESLREHIITVSERRNGLDEQLKQLQKISGNQHDDPRNQTKAWDDRQMELQKHIQDLNREAKDRSASQQREKAASDAHVSRLQQEVHDRSVSQQREKTRWQTEISTIQEKLTAINNDIVPKAQKYDQFLPLWSREEAKLNARVRDLDNEKSYLVREKGALTTEMQSLHQDNIRLNQHVINITSRHRGAEQRNEELLMQIRNLEQASKTITQNNGKDLERWGQEKATLSAQILSLERAAVATTQEKATLSTQIQTLEQAVLTATQVHIQTHLDHCRQRLEEAQTQVAGLQASEHKYRKDLETCQQKLGEARTQTESITIAAQEADRSSTEHICHLQAGKNAAEQSVFQLQSKLDVTKRRLLDSDETTKRFQQEKAQAENDVAELRRRFASSEQTLRRLQDDAVDAHGKLEEVSANTSNQLQVMGEKLKSSEAAANELRARESNIQHSLAATKHEITQLQTEKNGLHRQLSISDGRLETAAQTIQDLRNSSQSSRNDFETQLAELKRQNSELDRRLETAISDSQQTIAEHREKFTEYVQGPVGHMDWQDEKIRGLESMLGEACDKGTEFWEALKDVSERFTMAHTWIIKKVEEGKVLS